MPFVILARSIMWTAIVSLFTGWLVMLLIPLASAGGWTPGYWQSFWLALTVGILTASGRRIEAD